MTRLHFLKENIAGTAAAALTLLPYAGTEFYVQRAGRVKALTALLTEARTAGTLTFKVTKNGSAQTVLNATIDANATQFDDVYGDKDDLTFAAGDHLGRHRHPGAGRGVVSALTPSTSSGQALPSPKERGNVSGSFRRLGRRDSKRGVKRRIPSSRGLGVSPT